MHYSKSEGCVKMTKEEYDDYAKFYAEHHITSLKKDEVGNLVLCENREEKATRLYIHRFDAIDDAYKKGGWWDTFTVSRSVCDKKGFYLCEIEDFRIDRNGFLNMMVVPKYYLGTEIDVDSDAWDYFFGSGLFTYHYKSNYRYHRTRFNVDALYEMFKEDIVRIEKSKRECLGDQFVSSWREVACFIMEQYISGKITMEQIEQALNEKDDLEKLAEDLNSQLSHYGVSEKNKYAAYPLLLKKLPTDEGIFKGYYTTDCTMKYLDRKNCEYDHLKLGTESELLARVEAVLEYWVDIKAKEKEERKKKRKASKNS